MLKPIEIDFRPLPAGIRFLSPHKFGGFEFSTLGTPSTLFTGSVSGTTGLQFRAPGLRIVLPWPVDEVELISGAFAGLALEAVALDDTTLVDDQAVLPFDAIVTTTLKGKHITSIDLVSSDNEGLLFSIAIPLPTA